MIAPDEGTPQVDPVRFQFPGQACDDRLGLLAGTPQQLRAFVFPPVDRPANEGSDGRGFLLGVSGCHRDQYISRQPTAKACPRRFRTGRRAPYFFPGFAFSGASVTFSTGLVARRVPRAVRPHSGTLARFTIIDFSFARFFGTKSI